MNCRHKYRILLMAPLLFLSVLLTGCYENAWEDHIASDTYLKDNLFDAIGKQSDLSTFYAVLKSTGYGNVLKLGNSYTVFAPANSAWVGIDTSNVTNMKKLVGTLISYNTYFTDNDKLYQTIKAINGKNIYYNTATQTFNGAKITSANFRTANGALHITDLVVENKNNIWEYLSTKTDYAQFQYINSLNRKVMDVDKSVATGVNPYTGQTVYDTAWTNTNGFLTKYSLDKEDTIRTYVIIENDAFNALYTKYTKYFNMGIAAKTDSATRFNVCQDFVFKGIVDITAADTLVNVDGVKVPFTNAIIKETYDCSNGRVYIINQSNIRMKDKILPVKIEGENYSGASDANYIFTRYKLWASGGYDVVLSCADTQSDSIYRKSGVKDSVVSKTYYINSGLVANTINSHIEYKANVNSCNYDIYYVAYDDIADHSDPTYTSFGRLKNIQKLYISMPGASALKYGSANNTRSVINNYLGDTKCFVGQGIAGNNAITHLTQWNLTESATSAQIIESETSATVMTVPKTGKLTMWLCNTARSSTASRQGSLFLDYILLVPKITEE